MSLQTASLDEEFAIRGRQAWNDYRKSHDVSGAVGQVAAVEPDSGRVWIGPDALEAMDSMHADGIDMPAWFVRIGFDYLDVKGRR